MECQRIEEKLSAYIEGQLSSEEKMLVDKHLKVCSKCSLSLEELEKVITYAKGLEEIEPPPWLAQKVMTRVRQEAGKKKRILQKLFYPLHIKVPVEVVATLAIAVTAFYVFKTVEPEMKYAGAPSEEVKSRILLQEKQETKGAEDIIAGDNVMKRSQGLSEDFALPQSEMGASLAGKDKKHPAPAKKPKALRYAPETPELAKEQKFEEEADFVAGKTETLEEPPALAGKKTVPQAKYKAPDMLVKEKPEEVVPETDELVEVKRHDINLIVHVKDIETAGKEIEKALIRLKGRVIKTESFEDKYIFTAELSSEQVYKLREKLKQIGEVRERKGLYALKGNLEIKIEIVEISNRLQ